MMQFNIVCPVDGEMTVGIQHIENMVVHAEGKADITFRCPKCGTRIGVTAPIPPFLVEAMQSISRDLGIPIEGGNVVFDAFDVDERGGFAIGQEGEFPEFRERKLTAEERKQLEFFRFELEGARTVDDLIGDDE